MERQMTVTDPKDLKYAVILFAAFSVMITAVGAVGYFAITPLQNDIARLKDASATIVSRKETNDRNDFVDRRIEKVEKDAADARARDKADINNRIDAFRGDLNARIAEINRILEHHNK